MLRSPVLRVESVPYRMPPGVVVVCGSFSKFLLENKLMCDYSLHLQEVAVFALLAQDSNLGEHYSCSGLYNAARADFFLGSFQTAPWMERQARSLVS